MNDIETKNAKIESTMLGMEDHGILTCFLTVVYDKSCHQGFGGYTLDRFDKAMDRRIGTAYGMEFISRIMQTIGVEKWEDLKGKYCRIRGNSVKIYEIGHITDDVWFSPDEIKRLAE